MGGVLGVGAMEVGALPVGGLTDVRWIWVQIVSPAGTFVCLHSTTGVYYPSWKSFRYFSFFRIMAVVIVWWTLGGGCPAILVDNITGWKRQKGKQGDNRSLAD